MRRATRDTAILTEGKDFVGWNLGYDGCAEHEWGIRPLARSLGMEYPRVGLGLNARKITAAPFVLFRERKLRLKRVRGLDTPSPASIPAATLLVTSDDWFFNSVTSSEKTFVERLVKGEAALHFLPGDPDYKESRHAAVAAWGEHGFVLNVIGERNVACLKKLADAFQRFDIVIDQNGRGFGGRGGLAVVILSAVSQRVAEEVLASDIAHKQLLDAVAATGIEGRLTAAGRGWYALMPRWWGEDDQRVLKFFLNPREQRRFNHGWFTVAELDEWACGEGPVMREAASTA